MLKLKLDTKIDGRTLSAVFYQAKRLKKIPVLQGKNAYPIYIRLTFNQRNQPVRSILWKRLMEGANELVIGMRTTENEYVEIVNDDIELFQMKDHARFKEMCEFEFECLIKMITSKLKSPPSTIDEIVAVYNDFGQDGLRLACETFLNRFVFPIKDPYRVEGMKSEGGGVRQFNSLSRLSKTILSSMHANSIDPVAIIAFLHEMRIMNFLRKHHDAEVNEKWNALVGLITNLTFSAVLNVHPDHHGMPDEPLRYGIYFFPKILFFDQETRTQLKSVNFGVLEDLLTSKK